MFREIQIKIAMLFLALLTAPSNISAAQVAPTNLQGHEIIDAGGVTLTWRAANGAAGYNVYRNNQYLTTVTSPPYADYGLNGEYTYYVTAFDQSKQQFSGRSNEISISTSPYPFDPPVDPNVDIVAPDGLLTRENNEGEVMLGWLPVAGAAGYNVYRNEVYLDTVMVNETYTDNNPLVGSNEYYVTAFDESREHFSEKSETIIHISHQIPEVPLPYVQLVDPESESIPGANVSGYDLVFSDEFNGSELNQYRWNSQLRWDGDYNGERYEYRVINNEKQFYVNIYSKDQEHLSTVVSRYNPFEFNGNRLAIRAIRNPLKTGDGNRSFGPLRDMVSQQHFLSGAISTFDKFSQQYGYFEARMKIPSHTGTFPAFWLHHQNRNSPRKTEIDIMENLGHDSRYIYNTFHADDEQIKPQPQGQIFSGVDYAEDYHVYAVEWEPGRITWFIDGEQVSQLENVKVNYERLYLIINLAMGGNFTGLPTNLGGLGRDYPNEQDLMSENFHNPALEIDYVRVYSRR
ncbi:MAG: glycoside hydrolase family 16 protein [Methylococcaceae bacterium]